MGRREGEGWGDERLIYLVNSESMVPPMIAMKSSE